MGIYIYGQNPSLLNVGSLYKFHSALGHGLWPKQNGFLLSEAGIWNLFWRLGYCPRMIFSDRFPTLGTHDLLFVNPYDILDDVQREFIMNSQGRGAKIVFGGSFSEYNRLFLNIPFEFVQEKHEYPYAALAYLGVSIQPEIIAPECFQLVRFLEDITQKEGEFGFRTIGTVCAIHGERQTPQRATLKNIKHAPAIILKGNTAYFNANPFGAFQSWLQGQESLNSWKNWRHRMFWLDEHASVLAKIMKELELIPSQICRKGIKGLRRQNVVIKHDLDCSRDLTYLKVAEKKGYRSVFAILKDKNANFWLEKLRNTNHEMAFHYNTIKSTWIDIARALFSLQERQYSPAFKHLDSKGLLKQVNWFEKKSQVRTIHRHGSFIVYPEIIDALMFLEKNLKHYLGSNSFFRSQFLRWGGRKVDNMLGFISDHPDPQHPFWYPFKLANAANGGNLLHSWETTSLMEVEAEMLGEMLDYRVPGIEQSVFVLNYHPAHANKNTFFQNGSTAEFEKILNVISCSGAQILTLEELYVLARISEREELTRDD